MSAIWGCVDFSGSPLPEGLGDAMKAPIEKYKIDRFECGALGNVMMGCGIQYIAKEAEREPLPIFDEEAGISFTADCFIDNRAELINELCPGRDDIPDGELLFLAYKKWRDETPTHVRGSYSFAAYDAKTNRLQLSADHLFSRCVYYCRRGNLLFFSTLIRPIITGLGKTPPPNERWICGYIGQNSLLMLTEPEETPYEGILKVTAANYIVFDKGGQKAFKYWEPEKLPPLKLPDHREYGEILVSLLESAASEVTRCGGETGILLSGGLDSSAVAAFAAPELERRGGKLLSYTSVPDPKFVLSPKGRTMPDERPEVERLCQMYPNIIPKFAAFGDRDAFSEVPRLLEITEMPFKAMPNMPWMDGLYEMARHDGCRIILTGQMGNATISFGDAIVYMVTKVYGGRPDLALRFFSMFCRRMKISRKRMARELLPYLIPGALKRLPYRDYASMSYLSREAARRNGFSKRDARLTVNTRQSDLSTLSRLRKTFFSPVPMSHIGELSTKLTLAHGMISRDITKDKRIWEFCLRAPLECFVRPDGMERRMVREYLAGRLPPEHLDELRRQGIQSADWIPRLEEKWDEIYPWLKGILESESPYSLLNMDKVRADLLKIKEAPSEPELRPLSHMAMLRLFLDKNFTVL